MVDMALDDLNFNIQVIQNRIDRLERINDEWTFNPRRGNGTPNAGIEKQLDELHNELDTLLAKRRSA